MVKDINIVLSLPCAGFITQHFGENPQNYRKFGQPGHTGLDIGGSMGTRLGAMADGMVEKVDYDEDGYGHYVKIRHTSQRGFYWTLLAHMNQQPVLSPGIQVKAGQTVGYMGTSGNSTGPHVHCELQVPWDTAPGFKYYVANIEQYTTNTVPNTNATPGVVTGGETGSQNAPGGQGSQVKPGKAIINENFVNIRAYPDLTGRVIAQGMTGQEFDYAGEYIDNGGYRWRVLHVYVADDLVDERKPLTETEKRLVPGPR